MEKIKRYAVYYAPPQGAFETRAAAWLGRDAGTGEALPHPEAGFDVAAVTAEPRRYGFHGTLRAPFRLAEGARFADLDAALRALARQLAPLDAGPLELRQIGGFLALMPVGDEAALQGFAAQIVQATEPLRAGLTAADYARRRPEKLSARQRELLDLYGYPFVMEEFHFHLTLSDRLADPAPVRAFLERWLLPVLPERLVIEELSLFGETEEGVFRLLHRYALSG